MTVLVVGLGVTGEAVARRLAPDGPVTVVDDNPASGRFAERAAGLEALGVRVVGAAAGNIGRPLLDAVHDDAVDVVVAEVSSFQLRFTERFRPRVAVLLNVAEDHLDWHPTFKEYVAAKARIFANQSGDDLLVFNADDVAVARAARSAPARSVAFTARSVPEARPVAI